MDQSKWEQCNVHVCDTERMVRVTVFKGDEILKQDRKKRTKSFDHESAIAKGFDDCVEDKKATEKEVNYLKSGTMQINSCSIQCTTLPPA